MVKLSIKPKTQPGPSGEAKEHMQSSPFQIKPATTEAERLAAAQARRKRIGNNLGVAHLKQNADITAGAAAVVGRRQLEEIAKGEGT